MKKAIIRQFSVWVAFFSIIHFGAFFAVNEPHMEAFDLSDPSFVQVSYKDLPEKYLQDEFCIDLPKTQGEEPLLADVPYVYPELVEGCDLDNVLDEYEINAPCPVKDKDVEEPKELNQDKLKSKQEAKKTGEDIQFDQMSDQKQDDNYEGEVLSPSRGLYNFLPSLKNLCMYGFDLFCNILEDYSFKR